jgi:IS5 family transposase
MRPREKRETGEQDLFSSRLDQIIDLEHALAKLARVIDWTFLERVFGGCLHRHCRPSPFAEACPRA